MTPQRPALRQQERHQKMLARRLKRLLRLKRVEDELGRNGVIWALLSHAIETTIDDLNRSYEVLL